MTAADRSPQTSFPAVAAAGWLVAGWATASIAVVTVLEHADLAATFVSHDLRRSLFELIGGEVRLRGQTVLLGAVPFVPIAAAVGGMMLAGWFGSAFLSRALSGKPLREALTVAAVNTGRWASVAGLWFLVWITAIALDSMKTVLFVDAVVDLWWAVAAAGWVASTWRLCRPSTAISNRSLSETSENVGRQASRRGLWWVLAGIALYTVVYTAMNWQMYRGLLVPHGDSAMYEEHLWNVLHGKGFRSYLDQGLFLGEHIQFIHLALIPLYVLWPSHLLLEGCESFALALTALPVYWIARRHTRSDRAALWMSFATLLYFPLQYLDIAIDFKTFRPISFGVPLLMLAIDQMERRRFRTMALLFVATLTAKEDFAIVIAPLGLWLFLTTWRSQRLTEPKALAPGPSPARSQEPKPQRELSRSQQTTEPEALAPGPSGTASAGVLGTTTTRKGPVANALGSGGALSADGVFGTDAALRTRGMAYGAATAVLVTLYLLLAVKVLIPWFRGGETVHYARYFSRFGETPTEIVGNMLTQPGLLLGELLTAGTIVYALRLLVPLGGTPLLSPTRLLVGAPLFVLLCLNEIAQTTPAPVHHFHAPLVPIVLWAAAAGLPNRGRLIRKGRERVLPIARFACFCALFTGAVVSFHPLSIPFWDSGRATYWGRLFVPGERARQFAKIESLIPPDARVASTDFVHPRYTHYQRSYDYSGYLREVAGYEHRVPDDTDYIVIDTQHPYSTIKRPEDIRELREHPNDWELLPDETDGYFIVLKRRQVQSTRH